MSNNYKDRKVAFFDGGNFLVNTCAITDSDQPYKTAIKYDNKNWWITVEEYENINTAQKGHDEWVKKMTASKLPIKLKDVSTSKYKSRILKNFFLNNDGSIKNVRPCMSYLKIIS